MQAKIQEHINENLSFLKNKKVLIAISGGIDSTVLAHIFHDLHFDITFAHCNFRLRGKESNKDEEFVKKLGIKLQAPTFSIQFDTEEYAAKHGISTQMAARDLRYTWFQQIVSENNIDYILTAHQKDDVIETFLINLTRGTGLDGLTGIPEINGNIVRPLLLFSRNEILIYATRNKLKWREDSSNSSIKYVRNKIRHKVVPFLKELNPNLLDTFSNTLENLKGSQQIIHDCIENVKEKTISTHGDNVHFDIKQLKKLNNPKVYLYELLHKYGFTEWDDVTDLLVAQSGKQVYSNSHRLLKDRDYLILSKIENSNNKLSYQINEHTSKISTPIHLKLKKVEVSFNTINHQNKVFYELSLAKNNAVSIDYDKIQFPLSIRKWQKGDLFYPIGLNGKKKVSKFFKDEKFSLIEKEKTWLLCSKNEIVWIIGRRLDNRFKVSKSTSTILKISI